MVSQAFACLTVSVVEEMPARRSSFSLVINFPVHVSKDGLGLGIGTGFGKLGEQMLARLELPCNLHMVRHRAGRLRVVSTVLNPQNQILSRGLYCV